jgi:hypothetical protein
LAFDLAFAIADHRCNHHCDAAQSTRRAIEAASPQSDDATYSLWNGMPLMRNVRAILIDPFA